MNFIHQFFQFNSPDQFYLMKFENEINHPFVLFYKDLKGVYQLNNETHNSVTGFCESKDIIGLTDYDLVWSDSAPFFRKNDQKVITTGTPGIFLESGFIKDKKKVNFLSAKKPLKTRSNKISGILGLGIIFTHDQSVELFSRLLLQPPKNFVLDVNTDNSCLSQRQLDCLYYLVLGMTQKEIAKQMKLSPKTVEHYLDVIKTKLYCGSRRELIKAGLKFPYIKNKLFAAD